MTAHSDTPSLVVPRGRVSAAAETLPVVVLAGCAWASAWVEHGSIEGGAWLQYAVLAAFSVAVVLAVGGRLPSRAALAGTSALILLAGWKAASAAWSPAPQQARDEALLTALYALVLIAPSLAARTGTGRLAALCVVALGSGALAVAAAVELTAASTVASVIRYGRLAFPVSYVNAQAALFVVGFWPAVVIAERRALAPALRAMACGAAAGSLCGFVLTQSKGAALGLGLSAAVIFSVYPPRLRLVVPSALAVVGAASAFRPLTAVYRETGIAPVHRAGETLLVAVAIVALVGWAYALADRRVVVPRGVARAAGRALVAMLIAAALAGGGLFFARVDHPLAFAHARWHSFQHLPRHDRAATHFGSLGSNRYDFWRVAVDEFVRHPFQGIGAWGFGPAYLQHGRSVETPARAHSLLLEVLAENGVVGLVLLLLALGAPLAAAARRARAPAAAAALAGAICWLAQAAVDWTWTFPAAGIPFFLLLGVGAAEPRRRLLARRERVPAVAAALALAFFAFAPPLASARLTSDALAHPGRAHADLSWARALDPLSTDPYVASYELEGDLGAIEKAARMEPRNFAFPLLLGEVFLTDHRYARARLELERARTLYPRFGLILRDLRVSERRSR